MIADNNPRLPFLNQVLFAVQKLPDAAVSTQGLNQIRYRVAVIWSAHTRNRV